MLTMTMDHYQQKETFTMVLDYLNMIFIVIFSTECLMKMFALRYHYFTEPWNLFDLVVVILSILGRSRIALQRDCLNALLFQVWCLVIL